MKCGFIFYIVILLISVGQTKDIEVRLERHNRGHEAYTSTGVPWELVWKTEIPNRSEALKLEHKIKKRGAKRYLNDIKVGA